MRQFGEMFPKRLSSVARRCTECPARGSCAVGELVSSCSSKIHVFSTDYAAGQYVFRQHDPVIGIHVVCTGIVSTRSYHPNGGESGVHLVGCGSYLDATDILSEQGAHSSSAKVLTHTTVALVRSGDFLQYLRSNVVTCLQVLNQIVRQLKALETRQSLATFGSASERMGHLLCTLADLSGKASRGNFSVAPKLGRADLAALVGASQETISRLWTKLEKGGLVRTNRAMVHILDLQRLRDSSPAEE